MKNDMKEVTNATIAEKMDDKITQKRNDDSSFDKTRRLEIKFLRERKNDTPRKVSTDTKNPIQEPTIRDSADQQKLKPTPKAKLEITLGDYIIRLK